MWSEQTFVSPCHAIIEAVNIDAKSVRYSGQTTRSRLIGHRATVFFVNGSSVFVKVSISKLQKSKK